MTMPVNLRAKNVKLVHWADNAPAPQIDIRRKLQWLQAENQRLNFQLTQARRTGDRDDQNDCREALDDVKVQFDALTNIEWWLARDNAARNVDRARQDFNEYVAKFER